MALMPEDVIRKYLLIFHLWAHEEALPSQARTRAGRLTIIFL